jgi:hypothetical protein
MLNPKTFSDAGRSLLRTQRSRSKKSKDAKLLYFERNSTQNEIGRALCLCSSLNHQLAIVAKLLQPSGNIRRLITNHRRRDSGFRTQKRRAQLANEFFTAVYG